MKQREKKSVSWGFSGRGETSSLWAGRTSRTQRKEMKYAFVVDQEVAVMCVGILIIVLWTMKQQNTLV